MKTNIYMMLNEIESDTQANKEEEWSRSEAKRLKKKVFGKVRKKSRRRIAIAGVCTAAALVLVVVLPSRGMVADAMELLSYRIGTFLGIDRNLEPYEQIVDQSVTQNGITVTLNSVVLDVDELVVSTTETYEESIGEEGSELMGGIYVNGIPASSGAGGASRNIDAHTREVVMKYNLDRADVEEKMDVTIQYHTYEGSDGTWEFKFTADGEQLAVDTKTINLTYQYKLPDGSNITLTKFTSNAMGQKIFYETDSGRNDYNMMMKGTDNLGNPVSFYVSISDKQGGRFVIENLDGNLSEEAESLTLIPYAAEFPKESGRMSDDYEQAGEEFTIMLE